eukprot:jgi/Botrbrau1/3753/Bobra.0363s0030.1
MSRAVKIGVAVVVQAIIAWLASVAYDRGLTIKDLKLERLLGLLHTECGLLPASEFVIVSRNVVLEDGTTPAAVLVKDGKIKHVVSYARTSPSADNLRQAAALSLGRSQILDFGDLVVAPGLIDTHVHMNEPGRVRWEGMRTATRAAAAGGITTVIDMPLNSWPTTTTPAFLRDKIKCAKGKIWVDVGFWEAWSREMLPTILYWRRWCGKVPWASKSSWRPQALTTSKM